MTSETPLFASAESPFDATDPVVASQFRFLSDARHAVLPGTTYTVRAEDRAVEKRFFDLSLGLCLNKIPVRTRYDRQGRALPNNARFVVAWNDYTGGERLKFVVRFPGGAVYERVARTEAKR